MRAAPPTLAVAAKWINAHGGLNGHPVEIITTDDGGDPARGQAAARDLVEKRGAIAFVGNMMLFSVGPVERYLREKNIPVIGGDSANELWWNSPVLFPVALRLDYFANALAKEAVGVGKRKLAVFYCIEIETCKQFNDPLDAGKVGAEVVYRAQVSLTQPDFTSECLQARNRGAEAILLGMDANSAGRVAASCARQAYRPLFASGGLVIQTSMAKDPNFEGHLVAALGTFPWPATDPPTAEFHAAMDRYAPTLELSPVATTAWVSTVLLRRVGATLPATATPLDFLRGLWGVKNDDLGGLTTPLTFGEGQPAYKSPCYFVIAVEKGRFTAPRGTQRTCLD
ncbi:MAG TPA: ABC transporter substrate-binding protein [Acidimicrobiia bacterium]|nr:ABC transporter substrate-binding protein [Acidimicrobiia bacterium]